MYLNAIPLFKGMTVNEKLCALCGSYFDERAIPTKVGILMNLNAIPFYKGMTNLLRIDS